ncbi:ANTAR domain-containing protein [Streptomyces sp. NPDC102467]|uniref:ANTAR domain-containing protein n=1 Tax=Streptomyces sp. NPDC102467 TaxID=3366179 RepID=UPI00382FB236
MEIASVAARLTSEASCEPLDAMRVLAAFVESVRRLAGAHGAGVHYAPRGGAAPHTEGTSREVRALMSAAAAWQEGPDHEARTAGCALIDLNVTGLPAHVRWPRWAPRAQALGVGRVTALPLSDPRGPVGALLLLGGPGHALDDWALALSLTEMTADALFLLREVQQGRAVVAQLRHALTSRIVIEQAKGVLSVRYDVSVDEAFTRLRDYARSHQRKIGEIACDIIAGCSELPVL